MSTKTAYGPVVWPERFTEAQKAHARALIAPQPTPVANGPATWPLVVDHVEFTKIGYGKDRDLLLATMIARDEMGREKYGIPLTANNGRDCMIDAFQEALDMAVYLRADCERAGLSDDEVRRSYRLFDLAVDMAYLLLFRIEARAVAAKNA